jgi:type IV secretory pathway VirB3-like protein
LTVPILTLGLPDNTAVTLWVAAAGFFIILHQPWVLLPAAFVHVVGVFVTRADPHFFRLLRPALRARRRLDP